MRCHPTGGANAASDDAHARTSLEGSSSDSWAGYSARVVEWWRNVDPELQPQMAEVQRQIESLRASGAGRAERERWRLLRATRSNHE